MTTRQPPRSVVRLMGGLGNQLFQVAHALDLRAQGADVALDAGWFQRHGRSAGRSLDAEPVFGDLPVLGRLRSDLLTMRAARRQAPATGLDTAVVVGRTTVHTGYWQEAAMVDRVRPVLEDPLRRAAGLGSLTPGTSDYVAVHVRLGDYTTPATRSFHGLTDPTQQLGLAEDLRAEYGLPRIEVFTDSPAAMASILRESRLPNVTISGALTSWEALGGLSRARALVMSNSSLSWWAATLAGWCGAPPSSVACPHPWLAVASDLDPLLARADWRVYERLVT